MSKRHSKKRRLTKTAAEMSTATEMEQEALVNLYKTDADDGVDMTTLERRGKRKNLLIILVVVISLLSIIALMLGYIVFGSHRLSVNEGEVTLAINTVATAGSGSEVTLQLHYANHSAVTIDRARLELIAPQGFYVIQSDPAAVNEKKTEWEINSLAAGAEGTIMVTGQIVGQKDDVKEFNALFTYWPINFSSAFDVSAQQTITLTDSIIELNIKANEQAHTGEKFTYKVTFTNNSDLPLVNARALLQYPDGFKPEQFEPEAVANNNAWNFTEIKPGEKQVIKVTGHITGAGNSTQKLIAQLGLVQSDGFFNVQAEANHNLKVINPELSLQLTAPATVKAGNKLEYNIEIKNTSEVTINNLALILGFTEAVFASKEIALDPIPKLEPAKTITLKHTEIVPETIAGDINAITANLSVKQASVNDLTVQFDQTSSVTTKLQGNISLDAQGRYYNDNLEKIGSGPIPPQVSQTTTYAVRWQTATVGGDMNKVTVQTILPDNVTYVSSEDAAIVYDNKQRTVTLTIGNLKADKTYSANFFVSVTPTSSDVNKLMVLTNDAVLTAEDAKSGETIQATASRITTNIKKDPAASGDGTVIP
ncbi:MAG: hypothetical protein WCW27_03700 [Patescibacteria group bacterium]|jgi:hypothetical protein